ncbi:MAG: hypothetical protein KatS3mg003_0061 [Candidatus Nitrosocaldaceae archaeon]|nr:MAG: hypothetical protein KatS3mg003_0061 [Candidatus Nitrosocaldaceae archaeon]
MRILATILIVILLIQNIKVYGEELEIEITTLPERLISNSNAMVVIQYRDGDHILPFTPEIESILSSNKTVINIDESLRIIGNNIIADLELMNSGEASITVIPKSGKPVSKTFKVYDSSNIPSKLLLKIVPSTFSYLGSSNGYLSVQLVNADGIPIRADKDYKIELSSNSNIVSLDDVIIKEGEYYAIKRFSVKGYGNAVITAKYNDLESKASIRVIGPDNDIKLKLYIAPEIAPAMKGQRVYAFVQLQDSNGNPIFATNDMKIDIKTFTDDIITNPITIKAGESTGIAEMIINTDKSCSEVNIDLSSRNDFTPCIEVYAVTNGLKSESAFLELREYTTDDYIQIINSIEDPKPRLVPVLFPSNMPIIADGKEKFIGVIQLMSKENGQFNLANTKPIVPTHSIPIYTNNEELIDIRDITIEKPYSTALVRAKTGYLAGDAKVELFGDRLEGSIVNIKLYGSKNVKMVAEPLIDNIMKNINFPYLIYFIDADGAAAYATEDLNLLISMDNEIISIEQNNIKRGSEGVLLNSIALDSGNVNITFEAISKDHIQATSSITILEKKGNKIDLNIPDKLIKNSKGLGSIQILDDTLPLIADNDLNAYIYISDNKLLNIPKVVTIPQGRYFAVFPLETFNSTGTMELRVFIDGFEPLSKSIEIVEDEIKLLIESDSKPILNKHITLTLKALYRDQPLSNANVRWDNNKGLPIEYDILTDNEGIAKAKYLVTEEGEYKFIAKISYKGLEREIELKLNTEEIINTSDNTNTINSIDNINSTENDVNKKPQKLNLPINIEYLLIIPAVAGIAFSIIKKRSTK